MATIFSTRAVSLGVIYLAFDLEFIRHPRARRYVIRVREDGTVRVTLPRWGSKREAQEFAEQQRSWIERQRRRAEAERQETHLIVPPTEISGLKLRARVELPAELRRLAALHGLHVSKISVRNQRWRWGSCSPRGHICLNWRLILLPGSVRQYILIHELMHLKRLDHSRIFWRLVSQACPEYEAARVWLRDEGRSILKLG